MHELEGASLSVLLICYADVDRVVELAQLITAELRLGDELLIFDNASGLSGRSVRGSSLLPGARVFSSDVNIGYSGAMAALTSSARGHHLWLLNDDVLVERGWRQDIAHLLDEMRRGLCSDVVFPTILNVDGTIQRAGSSWSPKRMWHARAPAPLGAPVPAMLPIMGDLFIAPLIARRALAHISFDPRFHTYAEDFDLSYALCALGHNPVLASGWRLKHVGAASRPADPWRSEQLQAQGIRNYLVAIWRNYEARNLAWGLPYAYVRLLVFHGLYRGRGRCPGHALALLRLYSWASVSALRMVGQERRVIRRARQERRALSDREVWAR